MVTLAKKIQALHLRSRAEAKLREKKRKDDAKRAHERAMLRQQTPDGLNPEKRAKLLAAQQRLNEDPRNRAIVEQASLEKRVQQVKRDHHIGNVSPPVYMGEPVEPKDVPESIAQRLNRQKKERALSVNQERMTTAGLAAFAGMSHAEPDRPAMSDATDEQFGEQLKAMLARVQQPEEKQDESETRSPERPGQADHGTGGDDQAQREADRETQDGERGGFVTLGIDVASSERDESDSGRHEPRRGRHAKRRGRAR